jgi:hypothetical protein
MPRDGYESVSVPNDDLEQAAEYKPESATWGDCLVAGAERLNEHLDSDTRRFDDTDELPPGLLELQEATEEDLDEIKRTLRELQSNIPERTADELQQRRGHR